MRKLLGLLTVALLAFGCGSDSQRSITGPTAGAEPGVGSDRLVADQYEGRDRGEGRGGRDRGDRDDDERGGSAGPGSSLLGGVAGFAVFASSTITNTGPSVVTGDIGLTPGSSVTGFPPGTLTGTLHINDAATARAKLALQAAYDNLAGRPCNTVAPDLNGTLTPGVYCFSSSAQLNTTLVLDAQGNPNALFIFQIGTTLTTASNSSVTLINGASASNVFWQVGSSATLGTNTAFQGTIIAYASITMTTGSSLINGAAMALNGAVTLDSNRITAPAGGGGGGSGGSGGDDDDGDDDDRDRGRGRGGRGGDDGDRDRDRDRGGRGGDDGDRDRGRGRGGRGH